MFDLSDGMKKIVNDYKINVFEIAFLTEEQIKMFKSDFQIIADYFVQKRVNHNYQPSKKAIKHVDAFLKFMSVMEKDGSYDTIMKQVAEKEEYNTSKFSEQFIQSGIQQGIQQGTLNTKKDIFLTMIKNNYPKEEAQKIAGISDKLSHIDKIIVKLRES